MNEETWKMAYMFQKRSHGSANVYTIKEYRNQFEMDTKPVFSKGEKEVD